MGTDWTGGGGWAQEDHALRLDGLVRSETVVKAKRPDCRCWPPADWQVLSEEREKLPFVLLATIRQVRIPTQTSAVGGEQLRYIPGLMPGIAETPATMRPACYSLDAGEFPASEDAVLTAQHRGTGRDPASG